MTALRYDHICIDGTAWPSPGKAALRLDAVLRHGQPTDSDLSQAAAYIVAYRELCAMTACRRNDVVAAMRAALQAATKEECAL